MESSASCVIFFSGILNGSYALDDCAKDFLRSCPSSTSLCYLRKGQGVAGKALASYAPCFCRDVTRFTIDEYPLVHLARMSWLAGSFAICLRNTYTGDADYVLEFFLPRKRNDWDPRPMLCSLLETMKQEFPNFKVASGKALGEELPVEYIDFSLSRKGSSQFQIVTNSPGPAFQPLIHTMPLEISSQQGPKLMGEHSAMNDEGNVVGQERSSAVPVSSETNGICNTIPNVSEAAETVVTYEALAQHFGKKLDSVAESLAVSRSTLKRICRKHGIKRWPHRKRSKCVFSEVPHDLGILSSTTANSADEMLFLGSAVSTWPEPSDGGIVKEAQVLNVEDEFQQAFRTLQSEDYLSDDHFSRDSEWLPSTLQSENYLSDDHFSTDSEWLSGTLQSEDYLSDDQFSRYSEWLSGETPRKTSVPDTGREEIAESLWTRISCPDMIAPVKDKGSQIFKIKATWGEDTIRFPFSSAGGIIELKNEVAKRLGTTTFDMKYLDDDQERVIMTCDEDLSECFSMWSGNSSFRLLIEPIAK